MSTQSGSPAAGEAIRRVASKLRKKHGKLNVRTVGTGMSELPYALDETRGYWGVNDRGKTPNQKPPRLILQADLREDPLRVHFPIDPTDGQEYPQARTIGYITRGGCHFVLVTTFVALRTAAAQFHFPSGWEWVATFAFNPALPDNGSNAEQLAQFDPVERKITFTSARRNISYIGLGTCRAPDESINVDGHTVAYGEVTQALAEFFGIHNSDRTEDGEDTEATDVPGGEGA